MSTGHMAALLDRKYLDSATHHSKDSTQQSKHSLCFTACYLVVLLYRVIEKYGRDLKPL